MVGDGVAVEARDELAELSGSPELTPVIGAPAAQALASGVPVLTQADRLTVITSSATLQAIFADVDLTPVGLRAGDRAARRRLGQLRRQLPQHVHELRMALRGVQTASECSDGGVPRRRRAAAACARRLDGPRAQRQRESAPPRRPEAPYEGDLRGVAG